MEDLIKKQNTKSEGARFLPMLFSVLFSLVAASSASAAQCKDLLTAAKTKSLRADKELPDDAELNVFRFFSSDNTNAAHLASFSLRDGGFYPTQVGVLTMMERYGDSQTELLNRLQKFSTYVKKKDGQLSEDHDSNAYELLETIDPHQVSFIEITRPVEREKALENPEAYPRDVISDRPDYNKTGQLDIRQAGLWLVSGQYSWSRDKSEFLNMTNADQEMNVPWVYPQLQSTEKMDDLSPHKIYFGLQSMPWQRSANLRANSQLPLNAHEPAVYLDREKYPIVFEVGRLAQTESRYAKSLYETAVSVMVQDVEVMMHGKISDAFVFASAGNKKNRRRLQMIGFEVLENSCAGEACVLVQPLKKLADKFGVATNSYAVQRLKKHFPNYNGQELLRTLRWVKSSQEAQLDFIIEKFGFVAEEPIVVHDFSKNLRAVIQLLGMISIKDEEKLKSYMGLMQGISDEMVNDRHRKEISDQIPSKNFRSDLQKFNAIRLTNLSAKFASHPAYVPSLLMSLNGYLKRSLEDLRMSDVEKSLDSFKLNFVIQTTKPEVVQALRKFNMREMTSLEVPETKGVVHTFVVSRAEIVEYEKNMLAADEKLYDFDRFGLDRGFWFFRALSADPVIF